MTFTPARAYASKTASNKLKVAASVRIRKSDGAVSVMFTFNAAAADKLFGGLAGRRMRVDIGRGGDHGKVRFAATGTEGAAVLRGPRGSSRVVVAGWDLVAAEAQPASPLHFSLSTDDGVIFDLPPWGQPEARRAALDRDFGLKPIERRGA